MDPITQFKTLGTSKAKAAKTKQKETAEQKTARFKKEQARRSLREL